MTECDTMTLMELSPIRGNMMTQANRADTFMARILMVSAESAAKPPSARGAENALTLSLLFSGVRCLLQYALLPFLLPLAGVAADAALPLLLLINLLAMASIFFSLRRFWTIAYAHRCDTWSWRLPRWRCCWLSPRGTSSIWSPHNRVFACPRRQTTNLELTQSRRRGEAAPRPLNVVLNFDSQRR